MLDTRLFDTRLTGQASRFIDPARGAAIAAARPETLVIRCVTARSIHAALRRQDEEERLYFDHWRKNRDARR